MIAHDPDHLGAEGARPPFDDRAKPVVGFGLSLVGEVTREDDGLGPAIRLFDPVEELPQVTLAVDPVVEPTVSGKEVGVAQVKQIVVGAWILARTFRHDPQSITSR